MDEILVTWLQAQRNTEGFRRFWERIEKQFESKRRVALHQCTDIQSILEAEFKKGEVSAMEWTKNLPDRIMLETQTDNNKEKTNG